MLNNPTVAAMVGALITGCFGLIVGYVGRNKVGEDHEILSLLDKIRKRKNFSQLEGILNSFKVSLKKLADGEYKITGLHEVMEDDKKEIDRLEKGEILRKMTPLPNNSKGIDAYLSKKYRGEILNSTTQLVNNRGGMVKEIFVVSSFEHITDKLKEEIEKLEDEKIMVRVLCRAQDYKFSLQDSDIVIFGSKKASIGDISSTDLTCVGANMYTDEEKINRYIEIFERHYLNAVSLRNINKPTYENA
jgi:hypothetical protein